MFKRTIGFYPLSKYAVYYGHQRWKEKNLYSFNNSEQKIHWYGKPVLYNPNTSNSLSSSDIAEMIKSSRDVDLNIPTFKQQQLKQLAEHFAPVFLTDELSDADKFGYPVWSTTGTAELDLSRPVSFVRLAHTWFDGSILPQLVYTIWFPERPKESKLDILGGKLDGLIWRVTIDNNGKVLIADSIHPCGCYHLLFPAKQINKKAESLKQTSLSEDIETPQLLPIHSEANRLTLQLSANSHYLQTLSTEKELIPNSKLQSYDLIID